MAREGRGAVFDRDRRLGTQLFAAQSGNLAAPPAAGGKRHHQDRPIAQIAQTVGGAGRQQFRQEIAGDRLGALAKTRPGDGAYRKANGRLEGRGGEGAVKPAPLAQRRPVRQSSAHGSWRMRADGFGKSLAPKVVVDVFRPAVIRIGLSAFWIPEMPAMAATFRSPPWPRPRDRRGPRSVP